MKILFIGTVQFSYHMLNALFDLNVELVGVVSGEDKGLNSDYVDLEPICTEKEIPILITGNINSEDSISWIKNKSPDVIFCMGWSQLIKKEVLGIPYLGIVGYHPAELPKNRGRHPLIWALALGLDQTASTFFFMDEGADSGNIISQDIVVISSSDDAKSLYSKITKTATTQIKEVVSLIGDSKFTGTPQDHSLSNIWRKRNQSDGKIDWRMSATNIHNLVRALTRPYIGAHLEQGNQEFKVWSTRVIPYTGPENSEPGKIISLDGIDSPLVVCGEDALELISVEPELGLKEGEYL